MLEHTPDAENTPAFRAALGCFATGITLVTIATDQGPMGFAANSFASVSLDPPLVLWSPALASSRFAMFAEAPRYAIHVLRTDDAGLISRFMRGGAGFDGLEYDINAEGVPILPDALARFDCAQHATHEGGDHLIVVGRVIRFAMTHGTPLVFAQGRYGRFAPED